MAISLLESVEIGLADIWMRKVRSIVTIVGIILGVMSIMVVLAVVNGMNQTTQKWMQERGGLNKIEVERNWSMNRSEWGKAFFTIQEIQFIRSLIPEAKAFNPSVEERRILVKKGELSFETSVSGVLPDMQIVDEWTVDKGRFLNNYDVNNSNDVVVIGSTVASELFSSKSPLGQYIVVNGQPLMVIGVMKRKFLEQQGGFGAGNALEHMNRQVFVPLTTMLHKVSPNQQIDGFEVKSYNPEQATQLKNKLENIILNLRQGKHIFQVSSAQEQMAQVKKNSMIFTVIFVLIAVISLLVGGIVIMNIMLASIQERTREIGVRLAIGARRMDIFIQFMVQTILITTLGGILGIILGYSILGFVGAYLKIALVASFRMIGIALLVSVGVGLIFGITPAIRASNLNPVTALRNE